MNDVLQKQQNKPLTPTIPVPKKKKFLVLPYLGLQSKIAHKQIMSCIDKFYGCIDLRVIFQSTRRIKPFFPYKDSLSRGHTSALADHVTSTSHSLKWDHFEVLAKGRSDTHCKIKETLLIKGLKPTLNEYVSSERLCLYYFFFFLFFLSPLLLLNS